MRWYNTIMSEITIFYKDFVKNAAKFVQNQKRVLTDGATQSEADKTMKVFEPAHSKLMNGVVETALENGVEESEILDLIHDGTSEATKEFSK